jgi:hypothetical protein
MTPNEKAKKLVDKFYNEVKYMERAKQCALIAVDEILESHYKLLFGVKTSIYEYWQEVKQEIEKL